MTSETVKSAIQQAANNLKQSMHGYRPRRGQLEMMAGVTNAILDGFNNGEPVGLVAEAPCGTGKTIGYGLPAIVAAKELGLNVIISTATIALQEQLITKDLPELAAATGVSFKYKLLKGRGRYACPSRINDHASGGTQTSLFGEPASNDVTSDQGLKETALSLDEAFRHGGWDGDFDTLGDAISKEAKESFTVTSASCAGNGCRFIGECPFYKARETSSVDVFVVNHDLLLSAVVNDSDVIPDLDSSILIIDEAHALPHKAVDHFASSAHVSVQPKWIKDYLDKFTKASASIGKAKLLSPFEAALEGVNHVETELYKVANAETKVKDELAKLKRFRRAGEWVFSRYSDGVLPDVVSALCEHGLAAARDAAKQASTLRENLSEAIKEGIIGQVDGERAISDLGSMCFYLEGLVETYDGLTAAAYPGMPPWAKWFQVREKNDGSLEVMFCASPTSNGGMLRTHIFDKTVSYILTSATLTTLGNFDSFLFESGLAKSERVNTLSLSSPFDFENKALLEVPTMRTQPSDFEGFSEESADILNVALRETQASLVLFCSYRQMNHVYEMLDPAVQAVVQLQGQDPRSEMLREHAQRVKDGKPSCLFGVSSLAEGLDLRRELCTQVVIVKLPFAPPDNPVDEARAEWVEKKGGNPFMQIAVPAASLKLNQAAGRLLRTEDDFGRVLLLDDRLINKRYGSMLIDGLPPFSRKLKMPFDYRNTQSSAVG